MASVRERADGEIHIGLGAHLLSMAGTYRSAGISWYIQNLLRHLPDADPDVRYTTYLSEKRYTGVPELHLQLSRLPTHRPAVRIFWEQAIQPWALRRDGVDLLHGLALVGPVASPCPFVVTVHDLSFLHYPENFQLFKRLYLQHFTRASVQRARRVIAISESTKRDLVHYYGISPAQIDMIHYGLDPIFQPLSAERVAEFRAQKGLPEEFILFVGTLEPRKNVVRLIEAYAALPHDRPSLMLIGGKGWLYEDIFARVEALGLDDRVHFVGYVPATELPLWYNAAGLFVYPSLYEGFGLPPLEAMACGTPVVTSAVSSLPEVVGEAGLLVDPADSKALTAAMAQALTDAGMREGMREAGLVEAQKFSWEKAARHTVGTYRCALAPAGGAPSV